jgi:hypothetical protein
MRNALNGYFTTYYGAPITVTLQMTDINGNNVTNMSLSVLNRYTLYFQMSIGTPTSIMLTFSKTSSNSGITAIAPSQGI